MWSSRRLVQVLREQDAISPPSLRSRGLGITSQPCLANRRTNLGDHLLTFTPCLVRSMVGHELQSPQLGDPLLDEYLAFVGARARRNTWLAVAFDLKVFFSVVGKPPAEVKTPDVLSFLTNQRSPLHGPVALPPSDH
jgi:hypothetical protein